MILSDCDGDAASTLLVEQIDQSLGVVGGEIHRVEGAAVGMTRIEARLEAAALSAVNTDLAKAVVQTARFQTAIGIVHRVVAKHPLVHRQPHSALSAASTGHRPGWSATSALTATALIHHSDLIEWSRQCIFRVHALSFNIWPAVRGEVHRRYKHRESVMTKLQYSRHRGS